MLVWDLRNGAVCSFWLSDPKTAIALAHTVAAVVLLVLYSCFYFQHPFSAFLSILSTSLSFMFPVLDGTYAAVLQTHGKLP